MEKNMTLMMADLSGYTAMTEIHGARSAMEIVNRYMELAQQALYGSTRMVERTGDELMFVASDANDMLTTALRLLQLSSLEVNFLPLHAGLHYGPVLQQANSFFGTTVNVTARVAAAAGVQQLLCTKSFIAQVRPSEIFSFQNHKKLELKNIWQPIDVAELVACKNCNILDLPVDPVCRMHVDTESSLKVQEQDCTYYFCSENCLQLFRQEQYFLHNPA